MNATINPWHVVRLASDSTVYVDEDGDFADGNGTALDVEFFTCYNIEEIERYEKTYLQAYTGETFVLARRKDVEEIIEPALPPARTSPLDDRTQHSRSHDSPRDCSDDFSFTSGEIEAGGDGDMIEPLTCDYCGRELEFFFQFRGLWDPEGDEYVYER